jgi:hypothetical protein
MRYREERQGLTGQFDDLDEAALDALINDWDAAPLQNTTRGIEVSPARGTSLRLGSIPCGRRCGR